MNYLSDLKNLKTTENNYIRCKWLILTGYHVSEAA